MFSEKHSDVCELSHEDSLTHLSQHLLPGGGLGSLGVLLQQLCQFVLQLLHFVYILLQLCLK